MKHPMIEHDGKRRTKGKPDDIDKHVGKRLKKRRLLLGLSQEKLAEAIGLTFQQVQKYERGVNRIAAGRLYWFAKILGVPVSYFYEDLLWNNLGYATFTNQDDPVTEMLSSKIVLTVARDIFELEKLNPDAAANMKDTVRGLLRTFEKS